ncbi:queuosine precursor transporter [Candidatus Roizmanbacteria bacterium]|nr:queuosine precursor transporter [Candidatus Roizmanbacteria bacterium]
MKLKNLSLEITKMDFVIALYTFCILVSNMMGAKTFSVVQTPVVHFTASVSLLLMPLIFTINDVIIEVFGVKRARSLYRSSLIMIILLSLFSVVAIAIPPSARFAKMEPSYELIFGQSLRISLASLVAFALSDLIDILIFERLRKQMRKKALWFRNNVSNFISQFFDTSVFYILAFYAVDTSISHNVTFLFGLIIPYWLLKCSMSVIETPLVYLGVKWLKNDEKV